MESMYAVTSPPGNEKLSRFVSLGMGAWVRGRDNKAPIFSRNLFKRLGRIDNDNHFLHETVVTMDQNHASAEAAYGGQGGLRPPSNSPSAFSLLYSLAVDFCREQPLLVIGNFVLALTLAPIGDILLPHLYGKLVSSVEKQGVRLDKNGGSWWPPSHVAMPAILVLAALATSQIGWLIKDALDMHTAPLLENMVRVKLLEGLVGELDGNLPGEAPTGHFISQIARVPELAAWWWHVILDYAIPYGITLAWAVVYYAYIDVGLMMCFGALIVALIFLIALSPKACCNAAIQRDESFNKMHDHVDDVFSNLTAIYGGGTVDQEVSSFKDLGLNYKNKHVSAVSCILWYKSFGIPLLVFFVGLVVLRSCHLTAAGKMTPGSFVSVFMITTSLLGTLSWMLSLIRRGTLDNGSLHTIQSDFFGLVPPGVPPLIPSPLPPYPHEPYPHKHAEEPIEKGITMLDVSYGPLSHVTLSFPAGKISVVKRPVGWGKSTMFRLLAGLIVPNSGDIAIDGQLYSEIGLIEVRRRVAYMPQDAYLFNRTVYENVILGLAEKEVPSRRQVVRIADEIGLWEVLSPHLTDGIDTEVGKGGAKLSGGQKQLVWLLRSAVRVLTGTYTSAVLFDEPTASLDAKSREAAMHALSYMLSVRPDLTVVLIDHKIT